MTNRSDLSFSNLDLPPAQLDNLKNLGYEQMTEIQAQALPLILAGRDIIAQAKTGSGKTAAFALPLLNKINQRDFGTQGLILCPTRELSTQVAAEVRKLARFKDNLKVVILCGGQPLGPQIGSLEHGAHIVVGTPGRIEDHLSKKTLHLGRVDTLVLDEADRMLDMGFIDAIENIISHTSKQRQSLLFSATYPTNIAKLSAKFQKYPVTVKAETLHNETAINQQFYICDQAQKKAAAATLLKTYRPNSAVVFCNTKQMVKELCSFLNDQGISSKALHGDLEQRDRDQVLIQFKQQSFCVLVATDVAARGLDIADLAAVINMELPRDPEIYVHRIGRTGRAGKEGLALSIFSDNEHFKFDDIANYQNQELDFQPIETLVIDDHSPLIAPNVSLCIAGGRKQKLRPGDILGALTNSTGIEGKTIGKIDILEYVAYVAVARKVSSKAVEQLNNGKIKGRKFKVRKV